MLQRFSILLATLLCIWANAELIHVAESDLIAGRFSPVSAELLQSEYFNCNVDDVRAATLEDTLVEGWTNLSENIDINSFNLAVENRGVLSEILDRHPELFYVSGGYSYYIYGSTITSVVPEYTIKDKARIAQMNSELEVATANALSFIPAGATDLEKALVLHDYIATHCDYLNDETRAHIRDIYGVLVERKAVCAGYAITYNYLLSQVGINSEYVTSRDMNHAWSMVTLNGRKYHVDVTWDDPTNYSGPGIKNHVYHNNFLLNDSGIKATDHTSWEQASYYTGSDSKYNSYFWKDAPPYAIPCQNGYAYAFNSDNGKLGKYILSSGALSSTLLTVSDSWPVWDEQGYTWGKKFSSVQLINGALYYNTPTKIYSYNLSTSRATEISFYYSLSYGYIYGLHQEALGQLQAAITKSPNDTTATFVDVNLSKIPVTGITLSPTTVQLSVGGTQSLTATVQPSNATNKAVSWKSSNNNVATIDYNGKITAVATGSATITVTTADGSKTATCTVTVKAATIAVTGVTVSPTTAEMTVGDTLALTATIQPSNATNKALSWKSSNNNVATVDSTGKITAVAPGSATITVTTADGSKTATCAITVKAAAIHVTGVTISKTTAELVVGNTLSLNATIQPSNATDQTISWKSSNNNVATVDSTGKVTAVTPGSATITVTTADGDKTATCTITVIAQIVHVTGISLDPTSVQLKQDSSLTLTATIKPSNATNKKVLWDSSNKAVARITSAGIVIAVAPGTTIITATTEDGGMTASCIITVPVAVTGVTLEPTNATLNVGDAPLELIPHVMPANATDQTVSWTSSNSAVATVDSNGKVTAVAPGTATITVKTTDGSKTATCKITVPAAVTGVTLNCTSATIKVGSSPFALKATIQPSNATNKAVSWTSTDPSVATVDFNGRVTAIAAGTTIITATTKDGGFTDTCKITVVVPVKGVALNQNSATIPVGGTLALEATINPDNATDKTLAWSSSNNAVASVNANGNITAHDVGTATITVTTNDGDFTDSCDITVEMPLNAFQLEQGWNLVAFRVMPADSMEFSGEAIMECQSEGYVRPSAFQLHKAYWIYSTSKRLLHFTAASSPANESAPAEDEGFVGLSTAIPQWDTQTTTVYAWNGHGFFRITAQSQLEQGHGYWIMKSTSSTKP